MKKWIDAFIGITLIFAFIDLLGIIPHNRSVNHFLEGMLFVVILVRLKETRGVFLSIAVIISGIAVSAVYYKGGFIGGSPTFNLVRFSMAVVLITAALARLYTRSRSYKET
jgi:hypothetical protein